MSAFQPLDYAFEVRKLELSVRRLQIISVLLSLVVVLFILGALIAIILTVGHVEYGRIHENPLDAARGATAGATTGSRDPVYSNFARVTGTTEEIVMDFGLNRNVVGESDPNDIPVSQTVVMSHYTAKRLLAALQLSIERHEKVFGPLETDIQKRVK